MPVRPEAKRVRIGDRPLWVPGALQMIEDAIVARGGQVRVLAFGSGASIVFLLRRGAAVVTVEADKARARALEEMATRQGVAETLTIVQGDRAYADIVEELETGAPFEILLVDGRERADCLRHVLHLVKRGGSVILDDPQPQQYWPAFRLLIDWECVTFQGECHSTTIWSLGRSGEDARFVAKRFEHAEPGPDPSRAGLLVPQDYLGHPLEVDYIQRETIGGLGAVEAKLQAIGLIEREGAYLSPSVYRLEDCSLALESGHKMLCYGDGVFRAKTGRFARVEGRTPFVGAVDLPGLTLDLTVSGAGRYSFFLLDLLPKLDLLAAAGHAVGDFDTILINTGAPWARAMLDRVLGPGKRNVTSFASERPSFRMERSVHLEGLRSARFTPAWIHAFIDRTFGDAAASTAESFGPFVSISRQRASGRQIVNHEAFLELIGGLGFVEVFAEDHSPEELAARLREAKVLISPHGAGLANTIFAPADATVIELFSSHYTPQYFHLARDRGQDYRAFACVDADGKNVFDRYTAETRNRAEFNREDIVVPLAELVALLAPLVRRVRPQAATVPAALQGEAPVRKWSLRRLFGSQ